MQENLLKLLLAVSEGQSDEATDIAIRISQPSNHFNEMDFRHKIGQVVAEQKNSTLQQMDTGRVILDVGRTAADTGLYAPMELSLLGKTLLQLDQVGRILSPEFDPNESIRRNASAILNQRLKSVSPRRRLFPRCWKRSNFSARCPPVSTKSSMPWATRS